MLSSVLRDLVHSTSVGFVCAMLVPLLFLIVMVRDRRAKYVLSFFCWGVFCVLLAFVANGLLASGPGQTARASSDIAPIVEETLKALPLLWFLRRKSADTDLVIYCAMAAGIGFSVQETLFYFSAFSTAPGLAGLLPLLVRTVTTCLMHGMATAVVGYGIVITTGHRMVRAPMILGLFALAATVHSLFNVLMGTRLAVISLTLPLALYLLGLVLLPAGGRTEPTTQAR